MRDGTGASDLDLQRKDWAISAYLNENHMFSVNHEGVVRFDRQNTVGADVGESWTRTNWNSAMDACSYLSKKLPSLSQLKALDRAWFYEYEIRPVASGTSSVFTTNNPRRYWSSSPESSGYSWGVRFNNGLVVSTDVNGEEYVRCVS